MINTVRQQSVAKQGISGVGGNETRESKQKNCPRAEQQTLKGMQTQSEEQILQMLPPSFVPLHVKILQPTQQIIFSQTLPQHSGNSVKQLSNRVKLIVFDAAQSFPIYLKMQQQSPQHGTKSKIGTSPVRLLCCFSSAVS